MNLKNNESNQENLVTITEFSNFIEKIIKQLYYSGIFMKF